MEGFTEPDGFTNFFPEFDECIFDDLEFTSECIPQNRLGDVARDFNKAKVSEILCLRGHGCRGLCHRSNSSRLQHPQHDRRR